MKFLDMSIEIPTEDSITNSCCCCYKWVWILMSSLIFTTWLLYAKLQNRKTIFPFIYI